MTEINQAWLDELTRRASDWFNQRDDKWGEIFTEAFLIIPIAEFLLERNWKLAAEISNHQLTGEKIEPYQAFDLLCEKNGENRLLIEMKFLKPRRKAGRFSSGAPANAKRVANDFRRLRNTKILCHRIMIIGVHSSVTNACSYVEDNSKMTLGDLVARSISGKVKTWGFYLEREA